MSDDIVPEFRIYHPVDGEVFLKYFNLHKAISHRIDPTSPQDARDKCVEFLFLAELEATNTNKGKAMILLQINSRIFVSFSFETYIKVGLGDTFIPGDAKVFLHIGYVPIRPSTFYHEIKRARGETTIISNTSKYSIISPQAYSSSGYIAP